MSMSDRGNPVSTFNRPAHTTVFWLTVTERGHETDKCTRNPRFSGFRTSRL
jgi:hypothetical protein